MGKKGMCIQLRKSWVKFFSQAIQGLVYYFMESAPAHEILPGLWLGNKAASQDTQWLRSHQIGAIFNCTKDIPFVQGIVPHMYRIPVDDNLQPDEIRNLGGWAWEICVKLNRERSQGQRILVHCFAGMQRSAAVVAMLLLANYRCTTDEAIAFIKSRRPVAFLGFANFHPAIKHFETALQKMISETEDGYRKFPRIPLPTDQVTNT
jgi:rhodanese-related sulfurtransferase